MRSQQQRVQALTDHRFTQPSTVPCAASRSDLLLVLMAAAVPVTANYPHTFSLDLSAKVGSMAGSRCL